MKTITGFTTMELLAVMAIIFILLGIGFPAYNSWRSRSQIAGARAAIAKIEMALEMYKSDYGVYPQSSSDLNSSGNVKKYLNEYLEINSADLNSSNNLLDPWNNLYEVYVDHDGDVTTGPTDFAHNRSSYYILSDGPDGPTGNSDDDIDNYKSF